jgi:hypothetical protein
MRYPRPLVVLALVIGANVGLLARAEVRIQPVPTDAGARVLASFTARDAWTLSVREMLQHGQTVTFEFDAELKRPAPLWFFDPVLARASVSSSAKFDTLAGDYKVSRMRGGRTVNSDRRSKEADVREWLTTIEQVALDPVEPLVPNSEYYVRVSLTVRPRHVTSIWSILPLGRPDDSGRADFPFVK